MESKRIVIVGAGPSGMMAAIRAGHFSQNVTLIEKNPILGKKLLLSGKGRCNLTNACDLDSFLRRFSKNGEFLRDAFKKFFNKSLMQFFEDRGLKLKIERQLRVFPASDSSGSILGILKKELEKNRVKILYKTPVRDVIVQEDKVKGVLLSNNRIIEAEKIILATGGVSYAFTGSNGEGLEIARKLGHAVNPLKPGLVPLQIKQKYPKLLEGLTLKNIRLRFCYEKGRIASEMGELLFTDFGISGPLVLSLSARIVDWLWLNRKVYVEIDLKPALSKEQLNNRLLREFSANSKRTIKNTLKHLLPQRLVDIFLEIAKIYPDKKVSQITQRERESIVSLFKALRLDIVGSRPIEEAMVTRGGVSLKDIDPRSMESRCIKGLYLAGEMIDVDADTGGFNLQAAFSTGYLAGESAALN